MVLNLPYDFLIFLDNFAISHKTNQPSGEYIFLKRYEKRISSLTSTTSNS